MGKTRVTRVSAERNRENKGRRGPGGEKWFRNVRKKKKKRGVKKLGN